jgi:acyl-coenzyme A thioesterase PaaI-like protein
MERELTSKRIQFLKKDYSRGFIADVGYEAVNFDRGRLESRLKILNRHRQQDNYIHAGVIATWLTIRQDMRPSAWFPRIIVS